MKRSKRIQPLEELTRSRANELSSGMGLAAEQLKSRESQLKQLESYRDEYLRRSADASPQGDALRLQNYRAFLARLGEAIRLQMQLVDAARTDYERKRAEWSAVRMEAAALGQAVDRFKAEERHSSNRLEQNQSDETAQRAALTADKGPS